MHMSVLRVVLLGDGGRRRRERRREWRRCWRSGRRDGGAAAGRPRPSPTHGPMDAPLERGRCKSSVAVWAADAVVERTLRVTFPVEAQAHNLRGRAHRDVRALSAFIMHLNVQTRPAAICSHRFQRRDATARRALGRAAQMKAGCSASGKADGCAKLSKLLAGRASSAGGNRVVKQDAC